jgi:hypothetical protein
MTIADYRSMLRRHIEPFFASRAFERIDRDRVRSYRSRSYPPFHQSATSAAYSQHGPSIGQNLRVGRGTITSVGELLVEQLFERSDHPWAHAAAQRREQLQPYSVRWASAAADDDQELPCGQHREFRGQGQEMSVP